MRLGIKRKILTAFFIVIGVLSLSNVAFIVTSLFMLGRYKAITDNMILEYRLIDVTNSVVDSYNASVKYIDDANRLATYNNNKKELQNIFARLDRTIVNEDSRLAYSGLVSTINGVVSDCDSGLAAVKSGDFENISVHFDAANRKNAFVRENTGELILRELDYTKILQNQVHTLQSISYSLGIFLLMVLSGVCVYFAVSTSTRLITPLLSLTSLSETVIKGNLDVDVDNALLKESDEIGILAKSFSVMLTSLRKKVKELHDANKQLDDEKKNVEQKVQERTRELKEEHGKLLSAIDNSPSGFILLDTTGNVLLSNATVLKMLGIREITLENIDAAFPKEIKVSELYRDILTKDYAIVRDNISIGNLIIKLYTCRVYVQGTGVVGAIVTLTDVTEAKIMERSKDELLTLASHELRTPLTAIKGNVALIEDVYINEVSDDQFKEVLVDISDATRRMLRIVNDFLTTSQLEQGKFNFSYSTFDADKVVKATLKEWNAVFSQKNIKVEYAAPKPSGEYQVYADEEKTKNVLTNLISNSVKYLDQGDLRIKVQKDGSFIAFEVEDTGQGIPTDMQKLLFRKFQQAGASIYARETSQGTGLGLYICKLLVEAMGGKIELKSSTVGVGTIFRFTLPVAK